MIIIVPLTTTCVCDRIPANYSLQYFTSLSLNSFQEQHLKESPHLFLQIATNCYKSVVQFCFPAVNFILFIAILFHCFAAAIHFAGKANLLVVTGASLGERRVKPGRSQGFQSGGY